MFLLLVECRDIIEIHHYAIDPHADKTGRPHLLEYVKVLAFSVTYDRG